MFDEFVYVLKAGPFYKIGKTKDVTRRIAELAAQLPFAVELFKVINTNDATGLESELHRLYTPFRRNGEWFELPDETAMWLFMREASNSFYPHGTWPPDEQLDREVEWEGMRHILFNSEAVSGYRYDQFMKRHKEKQHLDRLCCFGV